MRLRGREGAVAGHVHVGVADRDNTCPNRDVLTLQSGWITITVECLMVKFDRLFDHFTVGNYARHLGTYPRMSLDDVKLVVGKRAGFVQKALGDKKLAHVVDARGKCNVLYFLWREIQSTSDDGGIMGALFAMSI